ncbi:MAG: hypothetical protein FWG13_06320, partial [Leptospirales bacterium]|nr:hypothetical protein [Leptospirales bacterium]
MKNKNRKTGLFLTFILGAICITSLAVQNNPQAVAAPYGGGNNTKAAYSIDGIKWKQTKIPEADGWSSVCYGNGKFVAVGSYLDYDAPVKERIGVAAYSTDGIKWKQIKIPDEAWLSTVCYGNGKFVAIADGPSETTIAAYSTDGIKWKQTTMPEEANWASVCYGDGKFIAVGSNYNDYISNRIGRVAYSTDGIKWKQTTIPDASLIDVCYGNGKFVAVEGSRHYYEGGNEDNIIGLAAYSTD